MFTDIEKQIPLHCPNCCRFLEAEEIYCNKENIVISCACGWDKEIKI